MCFILVKVFFLRKVREMKVLKILNNNALIALDHNQCEIVVLGLGIAFQMKPGDYVDEFKIEKIFAQNDSSFVKRFVKLIEEIPPKNFEVAEKIIRFSSDQLKLDFGERLYISLPDHIDFAIKRYHLGLNYSNPLAWEIKELYPSEYSLGEKALEIVFDMLGIRLPKDEAATIALYFVNAQYNTQYSDSLRMTRIIRDILNIIRYHFKTNFDTNSLSFHRLVTHLRFFLHRINRPIYEKGGDSDMHAIVKNNYVDSYACTSQIKQYLQKTYSYAISDEETTYLTIHIQRLVVKNDIYSERGL